MKETQKKNILSFSCFEKKILFFLNFLLPSSIEILNLRFNLFLKPCKKNHAENEIGRLVLDLFQFFKKALYEVKANGLELSFNHFRQSSTWQTIKTKYVKLQNIDQEICSTLIFIKGFGNSFSITFCVWFSKKNVSHVKLIN